MNKNSHTINFQSLKKFLVSQCLGKKLDFIKEKDNCEDSRTFGSAYHKILEQDFTTIKNIATRNTVRELDKTTSGFNLSPSDKTLMLKMIKTLFGNPIYQKYLVNSLFIHKEQNLCHFLTKSHYIFRLEIIIDAIVYMNGGKKIILDYKTINNLSSIDYTTDANFYWSQLLFYKYVYENSLQNKASSSGNNITDLYIFFQSKSKSDNYKVEVRKFSDLSTQNRKALDRKFQIGLKDYVNYILKHKTPFEDFKLPNSSEIKEFRRKYSEFCIIKFSKYFFRSAVKIVFAGCLYGLLMSFYHSRYFIFGIRESLFGLIVFIFWSTWFVFKK